MMKKRMGLTLTEVVVAALILGFAVIPLVNSLVSGTKMTVRDEHKTSAIEILDSFVEELTSMPVSLFEQPFFLGYESGVWHDGLPYNDFVPSTMKLFENFASQMQPGSKIVAAAMLVKDDDGRIQEVWLRLSLKWQSMASPRPDIARTAIVLSNPGVF